MFRFPNKNGWIKENQEWDGGRHMAGTGVERDKYTKKQGIGWTQKGWALEPREDLQWKQAEQKKGCNG